MPTATTRERENRRPQSSTRGCGSLPRRLRQDPDASVRRAADAGRSQDRRSVYLQFVRRLWLMVS